MEKIMQAEQAHEPGLLLTTPIIQATPYLLRFPTQKYSVDYDQQADVLYISFRRPQKATDTEMTDDGILLRYRKDELVGLTVLDASTRT